MALPDNQGEDSRAIAEAPITPLMRRAVAGGVGVAAVVAWVLGSSDWRLSWSEMWTTARAQLGTSDAAPLDHAPMARSQAGAERESASLP